MGSLIGRGYMLRIVMMIVCMLVSGIGNAYVGVGITLIIYLGYLVFMFAEGSQAGETQCTMTDTVRKIREQGKIPSDKQLKQCFNPKNGFIAFALLTVVPSLVLAIINLVTADATTTSQSWFSVVTRVWFLPEVFLTRLCNELVQTDISGVGHAAATVLKSFKAGGIDAEGLVTSVSQLNPTYIFVTNGNAINILNILYIPMAFLPGLAMLIGYLRGPKLRAKTLNEMMKGSNKKLRRMKKKRMIAPRSQKPEI